MPERTGRGQSGEGERVQLRTREEVDAQDLSTHCLGEWERTVTLVPSKCSWLTVQPGQAETQEPSEEH